MKNILRLSAATIISLAGCNSSNEPLKILIKPDSYNVGNVKSNLATPAVDEVIRIKPNKVLILACRATLPPKIIQFEIELRARQNVDLKMTIVDDGCPNA